MSRSCRMLPYVVLVASLMLLPITGRTQVPDILFDPVAPDVGPVLLGEHLDIYMQVLNNNGDLAIYSLVIEELLSPFSIVEFSRTIPAILGPKEVIDLTIRFAPTVLGPVWATVAVETGSAIYRNTISGTGAAGMPEPGSLVLLGMGGAALGWIVFVRRRTRSLRDHQTTPS